MKRLSTRGLCCVLLWSASPQAAVTGRILRCESADQERNYCLAYIRSSARLARQLSLADCRYLESWGYDAGGVWVDKGCRAEFFIRETQDLADSTEKPDPSVTELMNMTIMAETLNSDKMPDWSVPLTEHLKIGVDYNHFYPLQPYDYWQDFWLLPAFLRIEF